MFKINKVEIKNNDIIKQPECAECGVLPELNFRSYIVGASKSGKTNYLLSILTRFYKTYKTWDRIYVFSLTAKRIDPSYEVLKIPDDCYFSTNVEALDLVMQIQEQEVKENGKANGKKCLIILDDIVSDKKFCNSKELLKLAVMGRHFNISYFILSQAFHRICKSVRLQSSNVIMFKGSLVEVNTVVDETCPPNFSKKQYRDLINEATKKPYSFLFIDLNRSIEDGRYRSGLDMKIV